MAARRVISEAHAARTPPVAAQEIRGDARFVDEDVARARRAATGVSCHRRRAAATSGRRCSSACTVFFDRQAEAINRPPQRAQGGARRQGVLQLGQRGIGPGRDQRRPAAPPRRSTTRGREISFASAARSTPSPVGAASSDRPRPDSLKPRRHRRRRHPAIARAQPAFRRSNEYAAMAPPGRRSTMAGFYVQVQNALADGIVN